MYGAIAGDIVGSVYEGWGRRIKTTEFPLFSLRSRFTDDTVMTVATAYSLLYQAGYAAAYKDFGRRYRNAGYGGTFRQWLDAPDSQPYNSWGNGSAMRVSPVGMAGSTPEAVLDEARRSAEVTHNHPEGVKGAQAVALAVFLARTGASKVEIKTEIQTRFGYDLRPTLAEIRPHYDFDVSCQGSVPPAITAFLESEDVESAIRNAVSLGGDSDTLACIAGGIAEACYGALPASLLNEVRERLPEDLRQVMDAFYGQYAPQR